IPALIAGLKDLRDEQSKSGLTFQWEGWTLLESLFERLETNSKVALIPCLADAIAGKERCAGSRLIQRILVDCLDKQPEECVAHLTRLLTDRRKSSREAAHYAAKQIGPGAKAAIPALTKALADKEVRFEVACALAYIAGPDAKAAVPVLSEKGRLNSDS